MQLRDSQTDDFRLGQTSWTDRLRNSLASATRAVAVKVVKLGTALHIDVTDASNVALQIRGPWSSDAEPAPVLALSALECCL